MTLWKWIVGGLALTGIVLGGVYVLLKGEPAQVKNSTRVARSESAESKKTEARSEADEAKAPPPFAGGSLPSSTKEPTLSEASNVGPQATVPAQSGEKKWIARGRLQDETGGCESFEFLTPDPASAAPSDAEWAPMLEMYRATKNKLIDYASQFEAELTPPVLEAMKEKMKAVRIYRPPGTDEPDLAFRGIGIYSQASGGTPVLRIGPGFVSLFEQHPERARFEMARLLAQAWAPCEFPAAPEGPVFNSLLKCLGVDQKLGCDPRGFSDAGWALSTALANAVAYPGCEIPGLKTESVRACIPQFKPSSEAKVSPKKASKR
jgi:hypothetical protein